MSPVQFAFRSWLAGQGFRWRPRVWSSRCRVCGGRLFGLPDPLKIGDKDVSAPVSYVQEFLEGGSLQAKWQSDAMCLAKYEALVCPACWWERKCVQLPKRKKAKDGRVTWSVNPVYELVPPICDENGNPVLDEYGRPLRKRGAYPGKFANGRRLAFLTAEKTVEVLRGNVEPPFVLAVDLTDMKQWFQYAWWYGCEIVLDRRQFTVHADLGVWKGAVVVRPPVFDVLYRTALEGGDVRRESYPLGLLAHLLARRAGRSAAGSAANGQEAASARPTVA